eukprot:TRINITY_DN3743_c0_g1_i1.p1 TRINITY_DN3743_c0_g1~~TRINITY_DN3743_c0_g1_i1.p1  ORF type:complete len:242 (-),score=18.86 TRINITY_DN3743_c0_g1_i1:27-752(-)
MEYLRHYFNEDVSAFLLSVSFAVTCLVITMLFERFRFMTGSDSRKILHISIGMLYVYCWHFFSRDAYARYYAASIPFVLTIRIVSVALGKCNDPLLVKGMSRSGKREELLVGPLVYGAAMCISTVIWWRESIIGMWSIVVLCSGDGFAGIIGSNIRSKPLPWNKKKSMAGTLSFIVFSCLCCYLCADFFAPFGTYPPSNYISHILLISIIGAIIESLPISGEHDNLAVYTSTILILLLLGY